MTRARVCLASCMRVTRLMHVRDVTRLLPTWQDSFIWEWRDSSTCITYATSLVYESDVIYSREWCDVFIRVTHTLCALPGRSARHGRGPPWTNTKRASRTRICVGTTTGWSACVKCVHVNVREGVCVCWYMCQRALLYIRVHANIARAHKHARKHIHGRIRTQAHIHTYTYTHSLSRSLALSLSRSLALSLLFSRSLALALSLWLSHSPLLSLTHTHRCNNNYCTKQ